jgi:hypothetical protein
MHIDIHVRRADMVEHLQERVLPHAVLCETAPTGYCSCERTFLALHKGRILFLCRVHKHPNLDLQKVSKLELVFPTSRRRFLDDWSQIQGAELRVEQVGQPAKAWVLL